MHKGGVGALVALCSTWLPYFPRWLEDLKLSPEDWLMKLLLPGKTIGHDIYLRICESLSCRRGTRTCFTNYYG